MKDRPPIVLQSYGRQGYVQFNARMFAPLHRALKVYATKSGHSMSECVSTAIADFLRARTIPIASTHPKDTSE